MNDENIKDENKTEMTEDVKVVEPEKKKGIFHKECKNCKKIEAECAEYKSGWQRALADYKNLQKETSERRSEWARMSEQQILEEFIPVYDHLKLAINNEQLTSENNSWLEGVKFVAQQFKKILKDHGVEEMDSVGKKFDPMMHDAAGEEAKEGFESGVIVREMVGGYMMNGKVIRAAKVVIAK